MFIYLPEHMNRRIYGHPLKTNIPFIRNGLGALYKYIYRLSQEKCARLRESVSYIKVESTPSRAE